MIGGLAARDVWKRFPGVQALKGAEITAPPGRVVALLGKNGAGKTVLVSILAGLHAPDRAQIIVNDESRQALTPAEARHLGIALVRQETLLVPGFTALENIALMAGYSTRLGVVPDWGRIARLAEPVAHALGLGVGLRTEASQLLPGDQRLVMIAGALLQKAKVLILDEPTAALTPPCVDRLFRAIRGLAADGVSIIYVSQRLEEVFQIGDEVVVLRDGQAVGQWSVKELTPTKVVELITGGKSHARLTGRAMDTRKDREVLRAEGLCSGVIQDVNIRICEGEVVGLCGLSGSGKSTLAKLLVGADTPARGVIYIRGTKTRLRHPRHAMKAGIVLSPQDRARQGLVLPMTVRENITLPCLDRYCLITGVPVVSRTRERDQSRRMVDELSIVPGDSERPVIFFSGGNQQKIVLAKWLGASAQVFIFDEPTVGLDIEAKAQILELLQEIADGTEGGAGRAVIVISSDLSDLETVCNRVYVLRSGRVVAELTGSDLNETTMLAHAVGVSQAPEDNA